MDRLAHDPEVLWRQAGGVLVVGRADAGRAPLAIRGIGAVLWLALEEPRTRTDLAQLARDLSEESDDDADVACQALVDLLLDEDLLQVVR